ncbi:MAG TPA: type II toxin-antitoxin system VapC family toxin [Anaeromyxobacteraceae bacterium]|nr:type II toxin-antitoxin system VapC family toxin [Anaeromyxobacteraceae bacterium]
MALDTNVLVRFLVEDDAEQTARAAALLGRAERDGEPLLVSEVVPCELVWVLESAYGFARAEIAGALRDLLAVRALRYLRLDALQRALAAYSSGRGDFADYVVREVARDAGCKAVATFHRAILKEPGFVEP